jgi:hypothetical protein
MSQLNIQVIRNANVVLTPSHNNKGELVLSILVNGQYEHEFANTSRETQLMLCTDMDVLASHFNGGTYIVADDKIIEYRMSTYKGFIQSDHALAKLQEIIGAEKHEKSSYSDPVRGMFNQARSSNTDGVFLGGEWDKFDLEVKALGVGGEFENKLVYRYSPFSQNIITSLEVERLVCENGMVANSPFVTFEVPIVSDWENNLHVVSAQLKPKINDVLSSRFEQMITQRASVATVMKAHKLLESRTNSEGVSVSDAIRIDSLLEKTDVEETLGRHYKDNVFSDKKRAKRADSNLTQFDVFNILTEATTHLGRDENTDFAAQRELNSIVFDEFKNKVSLSPSVPKSQQSDHKRMFFGDND